jgi:soluble lytic murein transglycosylase-like protein
MRRIAAFAVGVFLAAWAMRRGSQEVTGDAAPSDVPSEAPQENEQESPVETIMEAAKDAVSGAVAIFGTKYDSMIRIAAEANGIEYGTLWRLLWKESRFREDIITGAKRSPVGALGIAQFMPATAREWLGSEAAALDPRIAIPGAARYLAWLVRQFGGDVDKAVAAYNWGIGNVKRKGLAAAPLETRQYVAAITGKEIA